MMRSDLETSDLEDNRWTTACSPFTSEVWSPETEYGQDVIMMAGPEETASSKLYHSPTVLGRLIFETVSLHCLGRNLILQTNRAHRQCEGVFSDAFLLAHQVIGRKIRRRFHHSN